MNGVPMKFDYSKTINEQLPTFDYYKNRYISYELELMNNRKEIERLNNIINEFDKWLISWIENEQYCFMSNNPKDRCRREVYEEVLHHFKELKGSNSNE